MQHFRPFLFLHRFMRCHIPSLRRQPLLPARVRQGRNLARRVRLQHRWVRQPLVFPLGRISRRSVQSCGRPAPCCCLPLRPGFAGAELDEALSEVFAA